MAQPCPSALATEAWDPPRAPSKLKDLLALTKPRVTLLVLFTGLAGLYLAPGPHSMWTSTGMILGTLLLVASANALNCYLERDADRLMSRTRLRPLPSGRLEPWHALVLGLGLLVAALPVLVAGTNVLTALLGLTAHVGYVLAYTPLKRRSAWSTLLGAVPGAMPPLMGWTAMTGGLDAGGLALFGILFLWQVPHTLAIGLFRAQEYRAAGIKVIPVVLGQPFTKVLVAVSTAGLLVLTLALHPLGLAGNIYLVVAACAGTVFLGAALTGLVDGGNPERWARGLFFHSMGYLTVLMAALCIDKLG